MYAQSNKEVTKMVITKIKIDCSSCDKYFILAHNGEDQPTCCPFCGSELEVEKEPVDDVADDEVLDYVDESEAIYSEDD